MLCPKLYTFLQEISTVEIIVIVDFFSIPIKFPLFFPHCIALVRYNFIGVLDGSGWRFGWMRRKGRGEGGGGSSSSADQNLPRNADDGTNE